MNPATAPDVSVLVVTYRNPAITRDCLRSVIENTRGISYELLVLDNASGDGTAEMIEAEFPDLDLLASEENLGFARGNNVLATRARGQFLLLLNPDTVVPAGSIAALVHFAREHPEGGLYGGRTLSGSGQLDPKSCWGAPSLWSLWCFATGLSTAFARTRLFDPESLGRWQRDSPRQVGIVTGCLALIGAELWRELGGFDESFWMYGEDADLSLRVTRRGYRPMITPAATITHLVGASSSTAHKAPLVLGSRVALVRKHWPPWKARLGVGLLVLGTGLRAGLSRKVGWRAAWHSRRQWAGSVSGRPQAP